MIIPIIILIIAIYFDGFLTLFLPYIVNNISFFTPMLTLTSLIIIYPFYRKKEKYYFLTIFIVGIIYDLLYINLLFYDAVVFFLFGFIIKKIYRDLDVSHIKLSLYIIFLIIIYELILSLFIIIFNLVPITLPRLIYKITHSILLNIIYGEGLFYIIRKLPKNLKRISIN